MILLPLEFYDTRDDQYSIQIIEDEYWLCKRHSDGQWVTRKRLTYDEVINYWKKLQITEPL